MEEDISQFLAEYLKNEIRGVEPSKELEEKPSKKGGSIKKEYPAEKPMDIDKNLKTDDLPTVLLAEFDRKGIAGDHISSMNSFYEEGIEQIVTKLFKAEMNLMKNKRDMTEEDRNIDFISFNVEFLKADLKAPKLTRHKRSQKSNLLTPNIARLMNMTYSGELYISAKISAKAILKSGKEITREETLKDFRIASIPVMVRSNYCNLHRAPKDTLKILQEDVKDPGGYFIIRGNEWCVDKSENMVLNMFHGYKNMFQREIVRANFQSKPGDAYENSYYIVLRYTINEEITVEIVTGKTQKIEIPYYLLFRAFGMIRDSDIVNNIVYGLRNEDPVSRRMIEILLKAMKVDNATFKPVQTSTDPDVIRTFIADKFNEIAQNTNYKKDENAIKYVNNATSKMLDKYIFPHIGNDPSSRIKKLRFLGHLIHKLLLIEAGILDSTDRDSYRNKRLHTAGISLAKAFKTQFNFAVIREIVNHLHDAFQKMSFSKVQLADTVRSAIDPQELENALIKSIVTGEKSLTIKNNKVVNRVSSQQLYHKNDVNVMSTLNNITTHGQSVAKSTDRAQEMRMPHPTFFGYIGLSQSADTGEKVGQNKQTAISASVAPASSSQALKEILLGDADITPLDEVPAPEDIVRKELFKVFVNGDWIGLTKRFIEVIRRYRSARRHGDINQYTTIFWDLRVREVYFWVDMGRLVRPLIIVYNNRDDYVKEYKEGNKNAKFKQWIKLTKKHIRELQSGKITIEDLRKERVIEYISPEEQENCFLCPNLDTFIEEAGNPLKQYTHLDIEQSMFGIVELNAPISNHTLATRITMFTNQNKQSGGPCYLNYAYRIDKNTFFQYYFNTPIVKSFTNAFCFPNSQNCIVAYAMVDGYAQEDSIMVNASSVDRGLFIGSHYYYEKTELEKGERFGFVDPARTLDVKKDASYEYIEKGLIREGVIIRKGHVLVAKVAKLPKPIDGFLYKDTSVVYKLDEPVLIERVLPFQSSEGVETVKIKMRSFRPIAVGDKLCLTEDHEVLTEKGWKPIAKITLEDCVATLKDGRLLEYNKPEELYEYDVDEELYEIESEQISLRTTSNHKMYVQLEGAKEYSRVEAQKIFGKTVRYKKNAESADQSRARIALNTLCKGRSKFTVDNMALADDIMRLALHCGWSADLSEDHEITINVDNQIPEVSPKNAKERYVHHRGKVYCFDVPNHVFYVRRNGKVCWTSNSSKAGCKGICAIKYNEADMPYSEDGLRPDLIVNPHSIPTRMTISQILEGMMGELATKKGCILDGTPYKKLDIDGMMKELTEKYGIKYGGYRRLFNGRTGAWMDSLIFMVPTTYQRLLKFVIDESYSMQRGATDPLTRQPLSGKANQGGLRFGEMEKDCLISHGTMRAVFTKMFKDSDGIDLYICRICGKRSVINEREGIYKCKICEDSADIVNVPSSWSANLFFNELTAMGCNINFEVEPYSYPQEARA